MRQLAGSEECAGSISQGLCRALPLISSTPTRQRRALGARPGRAGVPTAHACAVGWRALAWLDPVSFWRAPRASPVMRSHNEYKIRVCGRITGSRPGLRTHKRNSARTRQKSRTLRAIMRKAWLFPFVLLLLVSLAGALSDPSPPANGGGPINSGDVAWMLTATGLILLIIPGLSLFYGGMVRFNNLISTMLQSFVATAVISVLWVVVGFSLAFGDSVGGIVGHPGTYFMFRGVDRVTHPALSPTIPLVLFAIFHLKFAIITPALITGSLAERVRFSAYLTFMCLFSLLIYCPLAHMTWHPDGLLRQLGVIDFV